MTFNGSSKRKLLRSYSEQPLADQENKVEHNNGGSMYAKL
jgi:hypothetical protein